MCDEEETVWICYNGEVYGWESWIPELEARGHRFRTRSDTEFILHAWKAWGADMLHRLRGMFAIAVLDLRRRELVLIRDRMGIKPLVYAHEPGRLVFGSTLRGLLPVLPKERRRFSASALDAYLAHRYIPAPHTVLEGVRRLPRAHMARFNLETGDLCVRPWWTPKADPQADFRQTLDQAIELRTVADRPVGLFLSGGVDSATVADRLSATGRGEWTAFTAAFPGTGFDEAPLASEIAARLGMPHQSLPISLDVEADLERLVADLDEPFADPSALPLWALSRETRRHVAVVLGGDGGDELFAGYKRYRRHLRSAWRGDCRLPPYHYRGQALPGTWAKLRDELSMPWRDAYGLRFSGMPPSLRAWLQPDQSIEGSYLTHPPGHHKQDLQTLLALDMDHYLPEYILRKADLCTMAHGLELRVPLLDHRLYECVLSMGAEQRFTQPAKQALAAQCGVCGALDLLNRPKRGFNPPVDAWLRGPLAARLEGLGEMLTATTHGQISASRTQVLLDAWRHGQGPKAEHVLQLLLLALSLAQLKALP